LNEDIRDELARTSFVQYSLAELKAPAGDGRDFNLGKLFRKDFAEEGLEGTAGINHQVPFGFGGFDGFIPFGHPWSFCFPAACG
jgi:hypothetical protein